MTSFEPYIAWTTVRAVGVLAAMADSVKEGVIEELEEVVREGVGEVI